MQVEVQPQKRKQWICDEGGSSRNNPTTNIIKYYCCKCKCNYANARALIIQQPTSKSITAAKFSQKLQKKFNTLLAPLRQCLKNKSTKKSNSDKMVKVWCNTVCSQLASDVTQFGWSTSRMRRFDWESVRRLNFTLSNK